MSVLRRFGSLVVWGAALLLQVHGGAVWGARYEATVEFYVVPEQWLNTPDVADHFLPDAEVLIFAEGAFEPAIVASAHTPVRIPPGVWTATASAPGYVSTTASTLLLPDSPETAEVHSRVVLTVVEACEVGLEDAPKAWRGIQRVDFVSLEHGSVYPHNPLSDRPIRVPAGSFMVYTIAVRGPDALTGPLPCRFANIEQLARPEPPPPGKHSFMIHGSFPQGTEADLESLSAVLHSSARRQGETYLLRTAGAPDAEAGSAAAREPPLPPSARTASGNRVSFFYIETPARQEAQRLVLEHPRLRSDEVLVTPQDRGVRDFGLRRLKARRAISFGVHYRPLRPHEDERILLYDCGDQPQPDCNLWIADCRRLPPELRLQPGMASYRIDDLDDGQYMLVARIDDQAVPHLGNRYCPYLDPETDDAPPDPGILPLREMHIYGHLLVDDEPVAGEVRLESGPGGPVRRFPTDERLEYHLFYFGEKPGEIDLNRLFPEAGPDDAGELYGLYSRPALRACDAGGACRSFYAFSSLVGEGRLDFDLGSSALLELSVGREDDRRPVADAFVLFGLRPSEIHFANGEVREERLYSGMEGIGVWTGADGRARFRHLPTGVDLPFTVKKPGFADYTSTVRLEEEAETVVDVWLQREEDTGLLVRFPDGAPVAHGLLLPLRGRDRDWRCAAATNSLGRLALNEGCEDAERFILIHPRATITVLSPDELNTGTVEVPRSPAPPATVRIVDAEGRGIAHIVVGLRYQDLLLTPTDVSGAATLSLQQPLFFRTDERGLILLYGVDLDGPDVPDLVLYRDDGLLFLPLAGYLNGEPIELALPGKARARAGSGARPI